MKAKNVCIALVWGIASCGAWAQWQWIDEGGRRVFSDRPPPPHIAPNNILKAPRNRPQPIAHLPRADVPPEQQQPIPAAAATAPPAAAQPPADAPLTKEQQDAVAAEAERIKKEAQRHAQERQANCRRAQTALATLQSGVPLSQVNEQGQRGFMSAEQRSRDMEHARRIVSQDCGPAPS